MTDKTTKAYNELSTDTQEVEVTQEAINDIDAALKILEGDTTAEITPIAATSYDISVDDIKAAREAIDEPASVTIRKRVEQAGDHFYANSNISEHIHEGELDELIDEATEAFEKVLDVLVIDRENDPNSMDTGRRLAKMYINEIMRGRYFAAPSVTAFPNQHTGKDVGFKGMLVVRSEIRSVCSHHHQPVAGVAYIGIIPREKVIGLSKYTRLAQHLARRGTLQEELAEDIAQGIIEHTGSVDVAVYIEATHGCCENRGIMAGNSNTQTTVLHGEFMNDATVRKEFHDNVMMQKLNK